MGWRRTAPVVLWASAWMLAAWLGTAQWHAQQLDEVYANHLAHSHKQTAGVVRSLTRGLSDQGILPRAMGVDPEVAMALLGAAKTQTLDPSPQLIDHLRQSLGSDRRAQLVLLGRDGRVLYPKGQWAAASPPAGNDWLARLQRGRPATWVAADKSGRSATLVAAYPVQVQGKWVGAVALHEGLEDVTYLLGDDDVWVTDANGVVILAQNPQWRGKVMAARADEVPQSATTDLGGVRASMPLQPWPSDARFLLFGDEPSPMVLTRLPVPGFAMTVHTALPASELLDIARTRWMALVMLLTLGGAVTGIGVIMLSLRESRAQAHRAAEMNRLILDSANCGLWGQDSQGQCLFINQKALQLLGYDASELVGLRLHGVVHHSHADGTPYPDDRCPMSLTSLDGVARAATPDVLWHKNGQAIQVEYATAPMYDHGQLSGAVVVFNEISERLRHEQQLSEALRQAQDASRAKTQFLANMSHEVRTPMTAVIGFAEVGLQTTNPQEVRQHLRRIHEASKALLDILNDVLDLSRIEAGRLVINPGVVNLCHVLQKVKLLMAPRAAAKGLSFEVACPNERDALVITDDTRLRQILVNLVSNAIKFTDLGGVRVALDVKPTGAGVRVQVDVVDSGIGITEQHISRLFQPFSQVDAGLNRRFDGTGLGLSISQKLAQLLGGRIDVTSRYGVGSTFTLALTTLRANADQEADWWADRQASSAPAPFEVDVLVGRHVLVAEDNPVNQALFGAVLARLGLTHHMADNGQQALDALHASVAPGGKPFDAVLMDIQMPVMDGLEAARRIRQETSFARLPIIAVSAGVSTEERSRCDTADFDGFIAKPVDWKALKNKLETLLAR